jgi:lipoprotein-releasing system ATP-binding protein
MSEAMHDAGGAVELADVQKHFTLHGRRVEVLRGITLRVEPGEAVAVTGPSGSGKSTLLHLMGGLDRPSSGRLRVGDVDPQALSEPDLAEFRNRRIGFVFQDSHLLPQYSVLENVLVPTFAFPSRRGPEAEDSGPRGRARELLGRVGLSHRIDHRPAELSGGERQRVAVARALINRPPLLLCDEPTGSLDAAAAHDIGDLLHEIHREHGLQLIVVTHSAELAESFARRLRLSEGRCFEA